MENLKTGLCVQHLLSPISDSCDWFASRYISLASPKDQTKPQGGMDIGRVPNGAQRHGLQALEWKEARSAESGYS